MAEREQNPVDREGRMQFRRKEGQDLEIRDLEGRTGGRDSEGRMDRRDWEGRNTLFPLLSKATIKEVQENKTKAGTILRKI